ASQSHVVFSGDKQNTPGERPMRSRALQIAVAALVSAFAAGPAAAQGRGGSIPVAPLPEQPWEYQTASANIRVSVLTAGLENPWSLEFLPDASILITERNGRLRHFKDGALSDPIPGLPEVRSDNFISGLHDVKLHPNFEENRLIYWVYNKPLADPNAGRGGRVLTVARGVFDGKALTEVEDIVSPEGASTVSRLLFLPDGTLLVSTW